MSDPTRHKWCASLDYGEPPPRQTSEHDLDGTPLPAGHQEYTAEQERFDALWKKWDAGTITPEERAEMVKMQEKYWDHKHEQ